MAITNNWNDDETYADSSDIFTGAGRLRTLAQDIRERLTAAGLYVPLSGDSRSGELFTNGGAFAVRKTATDGTPDTASVLSVTDEAATLATPLAVTGDVAVTGALSATGAASIGGAAHVVGDLTVDGKLIGPPANSFMPLPSTVTINYQTTGGHVLTYDIYRNPDEWKKAPLLTGTVARFYWWFDYFPATAASITIGLDKIDANYVHTRLATVTTSGATPYGVVDLTGVSAATFGTDYCSFAFVVPAMSVPQANIDSSTEFKGQLLLRVN